ncbi:MAG: methionine--tRNA ligase [Planctomycetota bacterium]|nr:methionine--tRNA ligase [Planctomycetota bacterium]
MTRYLVTSALPYANGPIPFGHVIGAYLPADVYVRTLRMQGEDVLYVCGADEHGVAITIGAEREGLDYQAYVARWNSEIKSLLDTMGISFDVWSGTSTCREHADTSREFFAQLDARGYLQQKREEQLFCARDEKFLADRYVVGGCPKCGHDPARGDECPSCGAWLDPLELVGPRCKICGEAPERRSTRHWYIDLKKLSEEHLSEWFRGKSWKPNVERFVEGLLKDIDVRPITRDMRWGVELPAEMVDGEEGKVLYVWFDAPIGYLSFTKQWAREQGQDEAWRGWWQSEDTRLVHFIGKDNIPFHCLVFPSMLHGYGPDEQAPEGSSFVLPWQVPANEFYNLQGRKFNTSEGWTIDLERFFERYDPEVTRFYLLSSAPETSDSDWLWEGFQSCVNTGLADTIGNLVTRLLRMLVKNFDGCVPTVSAEREAELDHVLFEECGAIVDPGEEVRAFHFRRAAEALLANASVGNVFVDRCKPWALRKTDPEAAEAVLATGCQWLALLARWMAPFLPNKAQALWVMLGNSGAVSESGWPGRPQPGSWRSLPAGQPLGEVQGLFDKLEDAQITAELAALGAGQTD